MKLMKRFFFLAVLAALATVALEFSAAAWPWSKDKVIVFRDGEVYTRLPFPNTWGTEKSGPPFVYWNADGWQFEMRSNNGDEFVLDCYGPGSIQTRARTQVASRCSLHKSEKTELFLFVDADGASKNLHIWCE